MCVYLSLQVYVYRLFWQSVFSNLKLYYVFLFEIVYCVLLNSNHLCMYVSSFENDVYLCLYNVCVFIWNSKCMCIGGFHNDVYLCLYNVCVFIWNCKCMCIGAFDNLCFLIWNCIMFAYLKLFIVCCLFEINFVWFWQWCLLMFV